MEVQFKMNTAAKNQPIDLNHNYQSSASLAFVGNSPVIGEFPAQRSSNAENVFIWWRHHGILRPHHEHESCIEIYQKFIWSNGYCSETIINFVP